jgi:hypothetical protein
MFTVVLIGTEPVEFEPDGPYVTSAGAVPVTWYVTVSDFGAGAGGGVVGTVTAAGVADAFFGCAHAVPGLTGLGVLHTETGATEDLAVGDWLLPPVFAIAMAKPPITIPPITVLRMRWCLFGVGVVLIACCSCRGK